MINILVSVIIPTLNPPDNFHETLESIKNQNGIKKIETIIIDSGSDKKFLSTIKYKKEVKLIIINPENFSHGGTRNFAAKKAAGKYVVFLSQDAKPFNSSWLSSLITLMEKDTKIAGVYSKQIPKKDTHLMEKYFMSHTYGNSRIVNSLYPNKETFLSDVFFSNVSSAIRRDILLEFPFDKTLVMSEDQKWSKDVIEAGFKTVYEPTSKVIHSHNDSIKSIMKRNFDSGASLYNIFKVMGKNSFSSHLIYLYGFTKFLISNKSACKIPFCLFYESMKLLSFIAGWYERFIPNSFKGRVVNKSGG